MKAYAAEINAGKFNAQFENLKLRVFMLYKNSMIFLK